MFSCKIKCKKCIKTKNVNKRNLNAKVHPEIKIKMQSDSKPTSRLTSRQDTYKITDEVSMTENIED